MPCLLEAQTNLQLQHPSMTFTRWTPWTGMAFKAKKRWRGEMGRWGGDLVMFFFESFWCVLGLLLGIIFSFFLNCFSTTGLLVVLVCCFSSVPWYALNMLSLLGWSWSSWSPSWLSPRSSELRRKAELSKVPEELEGIFGDVQHGFGVDLLKRVYTLLVG